MVLRGDHHVVEPVALSLAPQAVARTILQGFDRHYALFRYGAQRAKSLFEAGDWRGMQQLARERIEYYDTRVRECAALLARELRSVTPDQAVLDQTVRNQTTQDQTASGPAQQVRLAPTQIGFWHAVKADYAARLVEHSQPECAETFFNSVSCRVLHRSYFHNDFLFVRAAIATDYADKGVHIDVINLYGSMELAPLVGLADAIVDLVSTGNTLKANGLVAVEDVADVSARLIVNQAALKTRSARLLPLIQAFARAVEGSLAARTMLAAST